MPLNSPRTSKSIKRLQDRRGRERISQSLSRLGDTLLALQDRKKALEREEQLLQIRMDTEKRLQADLDLGRQREARQAANDKIEQGLAREKLDFLKEQARNKKPGGTSSSRTKEERQVEAWRALLKGDAKGSVLSELASQVLGNVKVEPGQVGFAEAVRKSAEEVFVREPQFDATGEPITNSRGLPVFQEGPLGEFSPDLQAVLFEETLKWVLDNAGTFGTPVSQELRNEALGLAPKTIPPAAAISQLGEDPSNEDKAALAGSLSEQNRRLREQAGQSPGQSPQTSTAFLRR